MTVPRYVLDGLAGAVEAIADAVGGPGAEALRDDAGTLVEDPDRLAARIGDTIAGAPGDGRLERIADAGPGIEAVMGSTSHRDVQRRAQAKLVALVRELAAIESAARSAVAPFADRSALLDARDRTIDLIDSVGDGASDATYRAIVELRAALVEHLVERSPALARIVTTEELAGLPTLVASYRLYGDIDRAGDIAARNALTRPGFIPGGPVEVAIGD